MIKIWSQKSDLWPKNGFLKLQKLRTFEAENGLKHLIFIKKMPFRMKNIFSIALLLGLPFAAKSLDAGLMCSPFQTMDGKGYVEIAVEVAGESVNFRTVDSVWLKGAVETTVLIKQGQKIVAFDKFLLESPKTDTPIPLLFSRRFGLSDGEYEVEIELLDANDAENRRTLRQLVSLAFGAKKLFCSEIQLLRSFQKSEKTDDPFFKNGYRLEPLPFKFYDKRMRDLAFYLEITGADREPAQDFLIRWVVEKIDAGGKGTMATIGSRRGKAQPMNAVLEKIDIAGFESGPYRLLVELRDKQNGLLASKTVDFWRSNPYLQMPDSAMTLELAKNEFPGKLSDEELRFALRSLAPLLRGEEPEQVKTILQQRNADAMRLFVFNFFARRSPAAPKIAFDDHIKLAKQVDETFRSGFGYGFETDRGLRYMKYGKPSDLLLVENDPGAPPYEIWVYNQLEYTNQTNVKILFYNPSLAPNDFQVLTSTIRGEVKNPRWQRILYKNSANFQQGDNDWENNKMISGVGRHAADYLNDF